MFEQLYIYGLAHEWLLIIVPQNLYVPFYLLVRNNWFKSNYEGMGWTLSSFLKYVMKHDSKLLIDL